MDGLVSEQRVTLATLIAYLCFTERAHTDHGPLGGGQILFFVCMLFMYVCALLKGSCAFVLFCLCVYVPC